MFEQTGPPPLDKRIVALLILWCMLLPVWVVSPIAATGFRTDVGVNLFVIAYFLYPAFLFLAFLFKRSRPYLLAFPAFSFVLMFISGWIDDLLRHR
jgi:hypothetical protein